jgi:uncharacterized membrane protein YkvA (DUF1232 family)
MLQPPDDLPEETRSAYQTYLQRPPLTRELLIAKVRRYLDTLSHAREEQQPLDVATASKLAGGLLRLLRECPDQGLLHAQAAVYYFLEEDDAQPDLDSSLGFADDACVFNCVCRQLGLPELALDLL